MSAPPPSPPPPWLWAASQTQANMNTMTQNITRATTKIVSISMFTRPRSRGSYSEYSPIYDIYYGSQWKVNGHKRAFNIPREHLTLLLREHVVVSLLVFFGTYRAFSICLINEWIHVAIHSRPSSTKMSTGYIRRLTERQWMRAEISNVNGPSSISPFFFLVGGGEYTRSIECKWVTVF